MNTKVTYLTRRLSRAWKPIRAAVRARGFESWFDLRIHEIRKNDFTVSAELRLEFKEDFRKIHKIQCELTRNSMNNRVPTKFEVEQSKLKGIYNFCAMGVQWGNPGAGWGYTFFESPVKITRAGLRFIPPVNAQEMTVKDWTGLLDIKDEHKFTLPLDKVMAAKRQEAIEQYCKVSPVVYIDDDGSVCEHYVDPVKLSVKDLF